jgi:hypothetical protein
LFAFLVATQSIATTTVAEISPGQACKRLQMGIEGLVATAKSGFEVRELLRVSRRRKSKLCLICHLLTIVTTVSNDEFCGSCGSRIVVVVVIEYFWRRETIVVVIEYLVP